MRTLWVMYFEYTQTRFYWPCLLAVFNPLYDILRAALLECHTFYSQKYHIQNNVCMASVLYVYNIFGFSMYDILRAELSKCHTYIVLDTVFLDVEYMTF
jgi:hypothetical protein